MIYGIGSYSDLKSKCTVINTPHAEPQDPILEHLKNAADEIEWLLEDYDSLHLEHCYMNLKSAIAMYMFFNDEFEA